MFQPNHLIMTRRLALSGSSWFWSCRRSPVVWYLSPDELFNWSQTTTKKPHHRNFSRMTSKECRPSVYITLCHLSARQISRTSCLQTVNVCRAEIRDFPSRIVMTGHLVICSWPLIKSYQRSYLNLELDQSQDCPVPPVWSVNQRWR